MEQNFNIFKAIIEIHRRIGKLSKKNSKRLSKLEFKSDDLIKSKA